MAGLELSVAAVPAATTLLKFRHWRAAPDLTPALFAEVSGWLSARKLRMKEGTMVAAPISAAPSSTKHARKARGDRRAGQGRAMVGSRQARPSKSAGGRKAQGTYPSLRKGKSAGACPCRAALSPDQEALPAPPDALPRARQKHGPARAPLRAGQPVHRQRSAAERRGRISEREKRRQIPGVSARRPFPTPDWDLLPPAPAPPPTNLSRESPSLR